MSEFGFRLTVEVAPARKSAEYSHGYGEGVLQIRVRAGSVPLMETMIPEDHKEAIESVVKQAFALYDLLQPGIVAAHDEWETRRPPTRRRTRTAPGLDKALVVSDAD